MYADSSKVTSQLVNSLQRGCYMISVMVWCGFYYDGIAEPHFLWKKVSEPQILLFVTIIYV